MNPDHLLKTEGARLLYEAAKDLPIVDYHNHISPADLRSDCRYESLTALTLTTDPYKHRLMRICGVDEHFITGDADPYEKFERYCTVFPRLAGNPVYDWTRMELSTVFGIDTLPTKETARRIYDETGEMLKSPEFSHNGILRRFRIEYQSPVASLLDDLSPFDGRTTAPSLRGDNLLAPSEELKRELTAKTGIAATDTASYLRAVSRILDRFDGAGCRFADHALDDGFFEADTDGSRRAILVALAAEYKKRGWTLLLHLDAKRRTDCRLARIAGPAGGYAAVGGRFDLPALIDLLDAMDAQNGLPDTVLFPLSMSDQAPLSVLQGAFSESGTPAKVQLGPAWWWCDHALGIRNTLSSIASFGAISEFIGMTTDSRSVLSFVRHDYFRRLFCAWLDEESTRGEWGLPLPPLRETTRAVCYGNAKRRIAR